MAHFAVFIIVPVLVVGLLSTLNCLLITEVACGLCLATVCQLAHVVSDAELKAVDGSKIGAEWMVLQLNSPSKFCNTEQDYDLVIGWSEFPGEHHLFPKIRHVHYPAINAIVKETCMEYGIKYAGYATFVDAFKSHVQVIRSRSR